MCQLTFVHGDKDSQRLISTIMGSLLNLNATRNNQNGWGVFDENCGIYKSAEPANLDTKLEDSVRTYGFDVPIIGHVRLSSTVYSKLAPDAKNSHPFESEHYIVAHNGTLERQTGKINLPGITDSYDFTLELEKHYQLPFVKAIQETYKCFCGTFAFIIFEKLTGKYYIVRGNTKHLHKFHINVIMENGSEHNILLVNTEEDTAKAVISTLNYVLSLYDYVNMYIIDDPEMLKLNTIYEFDPAKNDLIELDQMKEVEIPRQEKAYTDAGKGWTLYGKGTYANVNGVTTIPKTSSNDAFVLGKKFATYGFSFEEIQLFYNVVYGEDIIKDNIPHHKEEVYYADMWKMFTNNKIAIWRIIKKNWIALHPTGNMLDVYQEYNLKFPFGFNTKAELRSVLYKIKTQLEARGIKVIKQ